MPKQQEVDPLGRIFRALGDATRRAIVARLVRGPASVTDVASPLAMSLPAVLQHLEVLEAAGLIVTEKVGRTRVCRLEPRALRAGEAWMSDQRTDAERRFDRLDAYLEEE